MNMTMAQTDKKRNSLNTIRLLAALQVFVGHAIPELRLSIPQWLNIVLTPLFIFEGVPVFFFLSGFLMWESIGRTKNFKTYVQKRVFRLYPELWGGVVLSAVVVLILYWQHIQWPEFVLFQIAQGTLLQFWTPGSLRGYATGTPNGPLWTICVMVQCYVVLWFLYKLLRGKHWTRWAACIGLGMCVNICKPLIRPFLPPVLYKLIWYTFANHIWLFLIGALLCEHFDKVVGVLKRFWWAALMISFIAARSGYDIGGYLTIKSIFLGLGCIGLGYGIPQINLKHDYSYGLYIYHMIVLNVMVVLGMTGSTIYLPIALVISMLLAVISYYTLGALSRKARMGK